MELNTITQADALSFTRSLPDNSINCVITSPPYYGLRDYGVSGQLGNEETYQEYIENMRILFCDVLRVLRPDGVMWLNLGDSYVGSNMTGGNKSKEIGRRKERMFKLKQKSDIPPKSLIGIPHRFRFALQDSGWIARQDIIWHKPNVMPESVKDRPTTAHEYIFLMTKSGRYWYDGDAIREPAKDWGIRDTSNYKYESERNATGLTPHTGLSDKNYLKRGKNKRSVWEISTQSFSESHFAVFPETLIEPMILAGCPAGGIVFDPFMGSGTTALVALRHNRSFIGCDINAEYVELARKRIATCDPYQDTPVTEDIKQLSMFNSEGI